jgi:hypothetical protein
MKRVLKKTDLKNPFKKSIFRARRSSLLLIYEIQYYIILYKVKPGKYTTSLKKIGGIKK